MKHIIFRGPSVSSVLDYSVQVTLLAALKTLGVAAGLSVGGNVLGNVLGNGRETREVSPNKVVSIKMSRCVLTKV